MSMTVAPTDEELEAARRERYQRAAEKLRQWSQESREYDERVGELMDQELKREGIRFEECDEPAT